MVDDLKIIKKKYGEEMMHFCRDAFATILEEPGVLADLLLTYFEPSKELFSDLQKENLEYDFKNFIYRKFNKEEQVTITETKTPQELLASVGYNLYECENEEDIQKFKKYYAPGEELCTFNGDRLNQCYVFFAVKQDVDNIKRENFNSPKRQDLYGTSVISIQFDKNEAHTLSIKNRYNHRVANPDATFSNNLDNIIEGLTYSFAEYYDLKQKHVNDLEITSYERDNNGKYYKYNYEINGTYYCTNNCILVNHESIKYPKDRYILADYFIIDRQEKTITTYDNLEDAFVEMFDNNHIQKIDLEIKDNIKLVKIETSKGIVILELDKENKIIGLINPYIEEIGNDFLYYNEILDKIELPQVKIIGPNFLSNNEVLTKINLPNVREIKDQFLISNFSLTEISLPKVEIIDDDFLVNNDSLSSIYFLQVKKIGCRFLCHNQKLKEIDLPKVEIINDDFLYNNKCLSSIYLPQVKVIGSNFLEYNRTIEKIYLPKVEIIGDCFLFRNTLLNDINMPNVLEIGAYFLCCNKCLKKLYMPNLIRIDMTFLNLAKNIKQVIINNEEVYQEFLNHHPEYHKKTLTRKLTKWRR